MAKKILIVEDEKILADMYEESFRQRGFDVAVAFSAEQGITLAKREKPDIVLLDILLPVGSGIAFLRAKKDDPAIALIPVVVFSNYDDPETKREAAELGALEYLLKTSFTPQQIIERVEQFLSSQPTS
jgi:DNA-binding response OmpR family regulator